MKTREALTWLVSRCEDEVDCEDGDQCDTCQLLTEVTAALRAGLPEIIPHACGCKFPEWVFGVAREDPSGILAEIICEEWPDKCDACPHGDPDDLGLVTCERTPTGPKPMWLFAADPAWGEENWPTPPKHCWVCGVYLNPNTGNGERNADTARVARVQDALTELETCESGTAVYAVDVIREALDQPQQPGGAEDE